MTSHQRDAGFGLFFAVLGAGLALAAWRLPEGVAGVPGPGVFPFVIGLGLVALGLGLAASSFRGHRAPAATARVQETSPPPRGLGDGHLRPIAAILALLAVYAALWETVPFIWRTPLLLLAIYRVVGEPWLRGTLMAAGATAVLALVFETLLRVRL
jgi:putative tricarboxylic transport membrane protein